MTSDYDYEQILCYAKQVKDAYPSISQDDLEKTLLAKFVADKDVLRLTSVGLVANPLSDHIALLSIIYNSLRKVIAQDKKKLVNIQDKIDKAVAQLISV